MSRSNPQKHKRRVASRMLLVFGEGMCEEVFLKYLKSIYSRDTGVAVTIRKGKGGAPENVVMDADKIPGAFDRKVVVLDNDKGEEEIRRARKQAKERGIELIEITPCLEAVLLSILNDGKSYSDKTSAWCKSEFESKYIDHKRRNDPTEYEKVFPKTLVDSQKKKIVDLEKLIALMT
ncbi:MAG: hypothetical protein HZA81_03360 [Candidatus Taylorbacteria bacterium]|nr:hypothetical protein [Candidatus Taylorbacteria bacterium]